MFCTMLRRSTKNMMTMGKRMASDAANATGGYREKSFKEIWLGDKGAYPIIVGMIWCVIYGTGVGVHYLVTSPDVKLLKSKREFFRYTPEIAKDKPNNWNN